MIFKLFACCIPVLGARRSIICDIQRGSFKFIPNILYEILTEYKNQSIQSIKDNFQNKYDNYIDSYFNFLEKHEFGFWCNNPEQFPEIEMKWLHPSLITNAIIDSNSHSNHNYKKIALQLDRLGCSALQIRIYDEIFYESLENIVKFFGQTRLRSIELIFKYSKNISQTMLNDLCGKHQRLRSIIIHSSPEYEKTETFGTKILIVYSTEEIKDHNHCGFVDSSYFVVNISSFTESLNFNNCLNKKISIDVNGEIKNCPAMSNSYGNIKDTTITDALNNEAYKEYWYITKDQVKVCCDCEFRYICIDCRAFTNKGGKFDKPEKCKYDPYTAKWIK